MPFANSITQHYLRFMKTFPLILLTVFSLWANDAFESIHADKLAQWMKGNPAPTIFDVNNEKTRKKYGVIPGAKLLNSSNQYALSILPSDKNAQLIFYCANPM